VLTREATRTFGKINIFIPNARVAVPNRPLGTGPRGGPDLGAPPGYGSETARQARPPSVVRSRVSTCSEALFMVLHTT
jgi:hypothetical protein